MFVGFKLLCYSILGGVLLESGVAQSDVLINMVVFTLSGISI
jgi:uncharacterized membrane protein YqaE (UPF0057 family)